MARFQRKVSDRDSAISENIRIALITHRPTGLSEKPVDVFSGFIFRGGHFEYYSKRSWNPLP